MTGREIPEPNRVGFTGTHLGMTDRQSRAVAHVLRRLRPDTVHHGDCLGADAQFDAIAAAQGVRRVAHPCHLRGRPEAAYRAFCQAERVHQPKAPLARNREIMARCQTMIVAHGANYTTVISHHHGTWATCRYARAAGRRIMVVWPDGTVDEEQEAQVKLKSCQTCAGCKASVVYPGRACCELGFDIDANVDLYGIAHPHPKEKCPKPITNRKMVDATRKGGLI